MHRYKFGNFLTVTQTKFRERNKPPPTGYATAAFSSINNFHSASRARRAFLRKRMLAECIRRMGIGEATVELSIQRTFIVARPRCTSSAFELQSRKNAQRSQGQARSWTISQHPALAAIAALSSARHNLITMSSISLQN